MSERGPFRARGEAVRRLERDIGLEWDMLRKAYLGSQGVGKELEMIEMKGIDMRPFPLTYLEKATPMVLSPGTEPSC